jgi:serpin B
MSGSRSMVGARAAGALATLVIVAAACSSAIATPPPAGPSGTANPAPAYPSAMASPSSMPPTASARPYETFALGDFTVMKGLAPVTNAADDEGAVAAGELNDFGFDLLRQLDSSGNLCASPASIALALAMVEPGARGQTAAEMARVLHAFGSSGQSSEIAALLVSLGSKTTYADADGNPLPLGVSPDPAHPDPIVELNVANQAFLQKGLTFQPDYLDALSSSFDAGVGLLDYRSDPEAARAAINKWAGEQTKGRIPAVLQPGDITAATRFALANAIYLKAAWDSPFDTADTKARNFTNAGGSVVSVPTMSAGHRTAYAAGSGYRAVELPMSGDTMSMTIIVPDNMAGFVAGLSDAGLSALLASESTYDVDLTLPRFSVETRTDLAAALAAMGMPTAFGANADLSGMTIPDPLHPEPLSIDKVIHQANIDVVEQGTTASAVTVVIGWAGAAPGPQPTPPPHVQFNVDKPFLYLIRDNASGAVLFIGRVNDPS